MGLLKGIIKIGIKVVLSPIYVPYKIIKELEKPSQYNHWYHDSGREQEIDKVGSKGNDENDSSKE